MFLQLCRLLNNSQPQQWQQRLSLDLRQYPSILLLPLLLLLLLLAVPQQLRHPPAQLGPSSNHDFSQQLLA